MKKEYSIPPFGTFMADDKNQAKAIQALGNGRHPQQDELEVFNRFLSKESTFLDIGANIGTITVPIARQVKEVLAFEPIKENIALLEENIRLNNILNVRIFPVALGSEEGRVRLETDSGDAGSFSVRGEGDVKLIPLDSLNTQPSFMKIDVEGYEIEVLHGARETIKKYHPVIWFEVNMIETRKRGDWWLHKVSAELKSLGYSFYVTTPDGKGQKKVSSIAWTMFMRAPKAFLTGKLQYSVNFLALPQAQA